MGPVTKSSPEGDLADRGTRLAWVGQIAVAPAQPFVAEEFTHRSSSVLKNCVQIAQRNSIRISYELGIKFWIRNLPI